MHALAETDSEHSSSLELTRTHGCSIRAALQQISCRVATPHISLEHTRDEWHAVTSLSWRAPAIR